MFDVPKEGASRWILEKLWSTSQLQAIQNTIKRIGGGESDSDWESEKQKSEKVIHAFRNIIYVKNLYICYEFLKI